VYVIQRTAPGERVAYWGRLEDWIAAPERRSYAQVLAPVIPAAVARFERWTVAFEVAEALRMKSLLHGEVIAVIAEPPSAAAAA
jgi:hypothetical protein